jgi:hypothetical protein
MGGGGLDAGSMLTHNAGWVTAIAKIFCWT